MPDRLLRRRLAARTYLFALIVGVLLPLLALIGLLISRVPIAERSRLETEAVQSAAQLGLILDGELKQFVRLLEGLAASSALARNDLANFHANAFRLVGKGERIIVLRDLGTRQFLNTKRPYGEALPPAIPLAPEEVEAFNEGRPVVSNVYQSPLSGEARFAVAVPILQEGRAPRMLAVTLPTSHIRDALSPAVPPDYVVSVGDRNGVIVTRSRGHAAVTGKPGLPDYLAQIRGDRGAFVATSFEGEPLLAGYYRSQFSGWLIGANIPMRIVLSPLRDHIALLTALAAGFLALSGLVAIIFANRFTESTTALARQARALGEGRPLEAVDAPLLEFAVIEQALRNASRAVEERAQERERTLEQRRLLINELNHRVKNTLAIVQAIASQTLSGADSLTTARGALTSRLVALAGAHDLLTQENWGGARLEEVLKAAVGFENRHGRIRAQGPSVFLPANVGLALSLVFHELATNASKYGALSNAEGQVVVQWEVRSRGDHRELCLSWAEQGGPPVAPPVRRGFGSRLLKRSFPPESDASVDVDYPPSGVICRIKISLPAQFIEQR